MVTLNIVLFILALMIIAYWRTPLPIFTGLVAVLLADLLSMMGFSLFTGGLIFIIVIGFLVFLNVLPLRQRLLSAPIYQLIKKILPPISRTEREAIDAGDTWWERELLSGNPHFEHLLSIPAPQLR